MHIVLWILAGLPVLVLAFVGLRYLVRGTAVRRVRHANLHGELPSVSETVFRRSFELLVETSLCDGNEIDILDSGDETYPRLWADLRSAQQSIVLQMYYCKMGKVADELSSIIRERARAGVHVLFLRDAFGALGLSDDYLKTLEDAGVRVATFRPVKWYAFEKAYNRSHIRVVTVDGRIGYTGGFGLDDKWLGDGRSQDQWRDTNARFAGPAVMELQATFAAGWAEATGELLSGDLFFPPPEQRPSGGSAYAGVMHITPTVGSTIAERFVALAITGSREQLFITNAYFVPGDGVCDLLRGASERGVDVRILTAGVQTDVKSTLWAGRNRYAELLAAGIRIYEYLPTTLHSKTLVVDDCFGSVGTMNFDNRSMSFNDETNLVFFDRGLSVELREMFIDDLTRSREVTPEIHAKRPRHERLLEWGAGLMERVL